MFTCLIQLSLLLQLDTAQACCRTCRTVTGKKLYIFFLYNLLRVLKDLLSWLNDIINVAFPTCCKNKGRGAEGEWKRSGGRCELVKTTKKAFHVEKNNNTGHLVRWNYISDARAALVLVSSTCNLRPGRFTRSWSLQQPLQLIRMAWPACEAAATVQKWWSGWALRRPVGGWRGGLLGNHDYYFT